MASADWYRARDGYARDGGKGPGARAAGGKHTEDHLFVFDTVTGKRRTYHNDAHHQGSRSDVTAFAEGS